MCTSVILKSAEDLVLFSRTMDFSFSLEPEMGIFPRNYPLNFTFKDPVTTHYSFAGLTKNLGNYIVADGVNEKGMVAATLYFEGFASYDEEPTEGKDNITPIEFVNWVLASYATVDELLAAVDNIRLVSSFVSFIGAVPPLHFVFVDKSGKSIILEPMADGFHIHPNNLGVMANAPDYGWHLTNVRNYINLDPKQVESRVIFGEKFAPFGQGSGTFGLPGDYTSPSRFIRTLFSKLSIEKVSGEEPLVLNASHVLNGVDIPKGSVVTPRNTIDYTQYTSYMVPETSNYYFRMYEAPVIAKVSLFDYDLDGNDIILQPTPVQDQFEVLG